MSRRVSFVVSLTLPPNATRRDAEIYIRDAVQSMKGALQPPGRGPGGDDPDEPGDPMFCLNGRSVTVRGIKR